VSPAPTRLTPEIAVVSDDELKLYKEKQGATVVDSRVVDPFDTNPHLVGGSLAWPRWTAALE
jgi:hypothetical protein